MADREKLISALREAISGLKEIGDVKLIEFSVDQAGPGEREVCIRYRFDNRGALNELGE